MVPFLPPYDDVDAARRGGPSPWVRSLDGVWRFRVHARLDDVGAGDVDPATSVEAWAEVAVPGSWVLPFPSPPGFGAPIYLNVRMPFEGQAPGVPDDNPTGVYRRTFTVPSTWRARRTLLRVGSANSMGFAWVNGSFVGIGTDSHLASTYDISAQLRRGTNTVCIAVPRWSASTWVEDQDQWWMPGLHRSVELVSVPHVSIADTAMVPGLERDGTTGTLDLDIGIDAAGAVAGQPPPVTIEVVVEALASTRRRPLATTGRVDVPRWEPKDGSQFHVFAYDWAGHRVITTLPVPGIEPWNHEHPQLYRAVVTLRDADGDILDVRTRRVGFRRIDVSDRSLLVNGIPVVINGVNHHDTHPDRGPATRLEDSRRDLEMMKRHHINAVRTSHYPHDESFYDLCDELGLYVVDEANVETHARWRAISEDPAYASSFLERGTRMVLRDRSHPSIVAWSLGNESGYGPSHDAMAAWIRRVDPSRPLHYEGGFSLDLDAANPVSDIVCPMYTSVEHIVRWSRDGTDRRPLILCEYNHAMGQAGGLADYWSVFGVEEGLQGGFVWEWADHGLRRTEPDGREWFAYGGDFGEPVHDGSFVCDGLVSPDRHPHPLLDELAALTQPVVVAVAGADGLRITNNRWFSGTHDLEARWELAVDGVPVRHGRLLVPDIGPRSSVEVARPTAAVATVGRASLTVTFSPRRGGRPGWATDGWVTAVSTVDVPATASAEPRRAERRRPDFTAPSANVAVEIGEDGIVGQGTVVGWPALSVWRAPTDNDDPPSDWRPHRNADRWREAGLDHLSVISSEVSRRGRSVTRVVRYETAAGHPIEHRQQIGAHRESGGLLIGEQVTIDRALRDVPRVGVAFELPTEFEDLTWLGFGPGDTYPDRRAAGRFGLWTSTVTAQVLPFVVPQEYGLHLDTEWVELASPGIGFRIAGDRPLAFSALPHSTADLTAAAHTHELRPRRATHVHLDVAHRGLGTAACGPDTHPRHLVRGGTHRFAWTLTPSRTTPT